MTKKQTNLYRLSAVSYFVTMALGQFESISLTYMYLMYATCALGMLISNNEFIGIRLREKRKKSEKEDSCMPKIIKIHSYEQCYFQQNLGRK